MIHCLLIQISNNKRGLPVRSYRTITASEVTIGRYVECTVQLADPRISMHHAVIKRLADGQPHLLSINGELEVDGVKMQSIALTHGKKIVVGPYILKVEPAPPDVSLALSLELANPLPDDFQNIKALTQEPLEGAAAFKRKLSLWLAGVIALIFLGLPLAQNFIPQLQATMAQLPLGFDRVWSPGHISNAHLHFGSQCSNCHQKLTQKVTDKACMTCHRDIAPHIADTDLQKHAFNKSHRLSDGVRCAECHREHKAPHPLARQDNTNCVKCHGNIKAIDSKTRLSNIHDFDLDHPGFKLTFSTGTDTKEVERIPQTDTARLAEKSGLKFPHSQHFGKVQGPDGVWDVRELSCTNCHRPEGKEMRFQAVAYARDCQTCHANQLDVGPAKATIHIPHGTEQSVMNTLKVQAPKHASQYAAGLKSDGCSYCHEISETKKGDALPWKIAPLNINQDWFSKAHFNHASHRSQKCESCHQVEHSESSADVAMPDRKSCLRCHSGNNPKPKRIASGCMSCHDFHSSHAAKDKNQAKETK